MPQKAFRTTYVLLAFFLFLLVLVVFYANEDAVQRRERSVYQEELLEERQVRDVTSIRFQKASGDVVELQQTENKWMLDTVLVDDTHVEQLMEALIQLPKGKLVSKNSENWSEYGLDEESATQVQLIAGEERIAQFFLGRNGRRPGTVYLRHDEDGKVYLVETDISRFSHFQKDQWREKSLFLIAKEELSQFTVRIGDERASFQKDSDEWKRVTENGMQALSEDSNVEEYFEQIWSLEASSFETDESLFEESDQAIAFTLSDGSEYVVAFDEQENQVFAKVTDQSGLYKLPPAVLEKLKPAFFDQEDQDASDEANASDATTE